MERNEGMIGVQRLQERISNQSKENQVSLHINRIPPQTKKTLMELADTEFCGDLGWAVKWLVDDMLSADTRVLYEQLAELNERVTKLEEKLSVKSEEPQTKQIRMGNGRVINLAVPKKEE